MKTNTPAIDTDAITPSLLASLAAPLGISFDGVDLVLERDPSPQLADWLERYHPAVRAVIERKPLFVGLRGGRIIELPPTAEIPTNAVSLAVEGDKQWHQIETSNDELRTVV